MSVDSFIKKWNDGELDQHDPICFPAAVDCVSQEHELDVSVYEGYVSAFLDQAANGVSPKRNNRLVAK